jgi:plastocyanin
MRWAAAFFVVGSLTVACGGSQPCSPEDAPAIVVDEESFTSDCLALHPGSGTTLSFENGSGQKHNLSIYEHEPSGSISDQVPPNLLFRGSDVEAGETVDITIPPLPEGTWFFRCDYHPLGMVGTLVVA